MVGSQQQAAIRFPLWALLYPEPLERGDGILKSAVVQGYDGSGEMYLLLFTSEDKAQRFAEDFQQTWADVLPFTTPQTMRIESRASFDEWRPEFADRNIIGFAVDPVARVGSMPKAGERLTVDEFFGRQGS